jgi:hypothetical protein
MTATNVRRALLLAVSIILGAAVLAGASAAHADVSCYHWDTARAQLQAKYGEVPTYTGDTGSGTVIVTVNPKTGTWTELLQTAGNVVCLIAEGEHWGAPPPDPAPSPAPATETDPKGI